MAQKICFIKMEGAGNDYVYVDCFDQYVPNPQAFARRTSPRHFGIGSDGSIFIKPSRRADCFMDIYNADGSRGRTCGNGLRCTAMYMWEKSGRKKREIIIETLSGIRKANVFPVNERKCWVRVNMGKPFCRDIYVPRHEISKILPGGVFVDWARIVDCGNLHCVVMLKSYSQDCLPENVLNTVDLKALGGFLENYHGFPGSVNVEICMDAVKHENICNIANSWGENHCVCSLENLPYQVFHARIWERGSGETLACGSGACALYRAASDFASRRGEMMKQCCIFMPGGRLCVEEVSDELFLSGQAVRVYQGEI